MPQEKSPYTPLKLELDRLAYLLFFLALYTIGTLSSIKKSWNPTLAVLALAGAVMVFDLLRRRQIRFNRLALLWFMVLLICFVNSARTRFFRDFLFYLLLTPLMLGSFQSSRRSLWLCLYMMVAGSLVFLGGVLLQYFLPQVYDRAVFPLFTGIRRLDIIRQYYRHRMYTGFSSEASISAQFMILGLASLYCLAPTLGRGGRRLALLLALALTAGIILTGKRSSLLFTVSALLFTLIVATPRRRRLSRVLALALVLALMGTALYFLLPRILALSSSRNAVVRLIEGFTVEEDVSNGRFAIWALAWDAFLSQPLLGVGWDWYREHYGMGAHNIYLQLLCECGLLGGPPVIAALLVFFRQSLRRLRRDLAWGDGQDLALSKFCVFSQSYLLLYGFTGNPLYNYSFLCWYAFSLWLALRPGPWTETEPALVDWSAP